MGRPRRTSLGGYLYHGVNRGNGRLPIFHKDLDHEPFLHVVAETQEHVPGVRLLAYCLMPNNWHLVLWPHKDGELSDFMHWLTLTHTQRWHGHAMMKAIVSPSPNVRSTFAFAWIPEFENLRKKVVEAADNAVPTLDEAMSSYRSILKG